MPLNLIRLSPTAPCLVTLPGSVTLRVQRLALRSRLDSLGLVLSVQLGGLGLVLTVLAYMVLRLLVMAMGLSLSGPVAVLLLLLLLREEMLHWPRYRQVRIGCGVEVR